MSTTLDTTTVRRWKRYPEYRPAPHPWLDSIPCDWTLKRVSWLFGMMGSGTTPSTSNERYFNGDIPWVNTGDLSDSWIDDVPKKVSQEAIKDHSALKIYPTGTLLIALYGATIGKLGILARPAATNQACFAMARPKAVEPTFLLYWFLGNRENLVAMSYGGGQPNISGELIRNLRVSLPPLTEQRAIAAFLDRETARIDALIGHKERLIALLEEKRQAVISHAVTRGLDPSVPLKDSGIAWLGPVPEHWELRPLGYCVDVLGGMTPSKENVEYWRDGTVPWVSPKDMKRPLLDDSEDHITDAAVEETRIARIPPESVLVVVRGMILARDFPVAINTVPVTINQDMKALRPHSILSPRYLAHQLRAIRDAFFSVLEESGHGTRCLRTELWKGLRIVVPPHQEQQSICGAIDRRTETITQAISRIGESIARLQEYRTALISAAVTGQIDVRGEVSL
jgi:restriction endonuclease S subunit